MVLVVNRNGSENLLFTRANCFHWLFWLTSFFLNLWIVEMFLKRCWRVIGMNQIGIIFWILVLNSVNILFGLILIDSLNSLINIVHLLGFFVTFWIQRLRIVAHHEHLSERIHSRWLDCSSLSHLLLIINSMILEVYLHSERIFRLFTCIELFWISNAIYFSLHLSNRLWNQF